MIFSIQHYIEDYLEHRNLSDVDQYAIRLSNSFVRTMHLTKEADVVKSIHRIRTTFFRNNPQVNRDEFEALLVRLLRSRFKKKGQFEIFPGGVGPEHRAILQRPRITIHSILDGFVHAIESRAVDPFWQSRKKNKLAKRPETVGQALFATFAKGMLANHKKSLVLREVSSGIGFVDIGIVIVNSFHLIEMKILSSRFTGASQLETYMKTEGRNHGWLVLFDARPQTKRPPIPNSIKTKTGKINVIRIDINPLRPSQNK